jgi:uncharacterized damage-inducible protein DinB
MDKPEHWLRGPVADVPALLQPVAHALLQARDDVHAIMSGFPDDRLWITPVESASVGFHMLHLAGALDRMLTYAKGDELSDAQWQTLKQQRGPVDRTAKQLVRDFDAEVDTALAQLRVTLDHSLTEPRGVGREHLPSTVIGLLFHAAEHTQRHVGQLLVTARVVRAMHVE